MLEASGVTSLLGGNTYAALPLSALTNWPGDVMVAELSSFQLERSPTLVPEAGVLTNIARDHLDRHGSRDRYAAAKTGMLRAPTPAPATPPSASTTSTAPGSRGGFASGVPKS